MTTKTALKKAIKIVGGKAALAKGLGLAYQSVDGWITRNAMPRTEYNGKTKHATKIQEMTGGEVTVEDLCGFVPPPQA